MLSTHWGDPDLSAVQKPPWVSTALIWMRAAWKFFDKMALNWESTQMLPEGNQSMMIR